MKIIAQKIETEGGAVVLLLELVDRGLSVSMEREADGTYTVAGLGDARGGYADQIDAAKRTLDTWPDWLKVRP
jgi:hypothetical protein